MRIDHLLSGIVFINVSLLALPACEIHSISGNLTTGAGGSGGATASSSSGVGGASTTGVGGGVTASTSGATSSSGTGGSVGVPCAPAASRVYMITTDSKLYGLDFVTGNSWVTTLIGALACPTAAAPYSIAVDRSAQAWVVYTDGKLYKVDTATAACTATPFVAGQHGFTSFSMAFAADAPGGDTETLYVSGSGVSGSPTGLATLDRSTLTLTPVGDYDAAPVNNAPVTPPVQLTGGADAQLSGGFLLNAAYFLGHFDKTNAHVIETTNESTTLIDAQPPTNHYAVIPWGAKYHIFVTEGTGTRDYLDLNDGAAIVTNGGAAGVIPLPLLTLSASTCATAVELQ